MSKTVARDLAALPDLYDACEAVLAGCPRTTDRRVSGGLPRGLNLHEGALRARSRMLAVLASWSGLVACERGVSGPARREVAALSGFLLAHLDWLAAHPAADDFTDEIRGIAAEAREAACRDSVVRRDLGACPRTACGRPVLATLGAGGPVNVRCEAGHALPTHQWLLLSGVVHQ